MVCYGIIRPVIFVTLPWTLHQTKALQTQSHWPHTMCLGLILRDLFASFFLKYISSFFNWFFRKSGILRMRALPATYVEGFHDLEAVKKMKYQPLGRTGMDVSKLSFGKVVSESFNQMQKCWDTLTKTGLSDFKSQLFTHLWEIKLTPSLPFIQSRSPSIDELLFKAVLPSFEYVLLWLATLIRGGEGIRSLSIQLLSLAR